MTGRVLVHGGVDSRSSPEVIEGLRKAASAGLSALGEHGAVEAAETAVRLLEADPLFNAGIGSVLNEDGDVETDAAIVDGTGGRFAGVAALTDIRYPVSVARALLRTSPGPVLLAGTGARRFAAALQAPTGDLRTPEQLSSWREAKRGRDRAVSPFTGRVAAASDTVGAIVVDQRGRIAAASSTGGVQMKMPGRVGDSAIFGAGIYADADRAVLCSGLGEAAIELSLALRVALRCEVTGDPDDAVSWAVARLSEREAIGGVLLCDLRSDRVAVAHNASSFPVIEAAEDASRVVAPASGPGGADG
jgi:beta-aspartyl-peptidase (threonine type)